MNSQFKVLIFDLGGVLLEWDAHTIDAISPSHLKQLMHSEEWHDLDKGTVTIDEAYENFSRLINVDAYDIKQALRQAQESLTVNPKLLKVAKELKEFNPDLGLYIMSNISREHFEVVKTLDLPWSLFTGIFASGHVGKRKPDLEFFTTVIDQIGLPASQMVMVDDQPENICAARSMGIHGIVTQKSSLEDTGLVLWSMFHNPGPRAKAFMVSNAGNHHCSVEGHPDIVLKDNFAQLLILGFHGDPDIVYLKFPSGKLHHPAYGHFYDTRNPEIKSSKKVENGLWNYFYEKPILTTEEFPPDADTTSTAYLCLPPHYLSELADVHLVLDKMASNVGSDGIMQTYFCDGRQRISPEVCVNMIRLFYRFGRGGDPRIRKTEDWVVKCLENRACLYGNRFYSTPESFHYFVAQLWAESEPIHLSYGEKSLRQRLDPIKDAVREQVNIPTNPLALALRLRSCQIVGIDPLIYRSDMRQFIATQEKDGGFPAGHFCCFGRTGARIGNRGLTTALAIQIFLHEESSA